MIFKAFGQHNRKLFKVRAGSEPDAWRKVNAVHAKRPSSAQIAFEVVRLDLMADDPDHYDRFLPFLKPIRAKA